MIAKAIKLIDEAIAKDDIDEIMLDDLELHEITPELKKKLESVSQMSVLTLNNCSLKTLANFPHLNNLVRVELAQNKFPASELAHLKAIKECQSICLNDNDIKSVDDLKVFKDMECIQLEIEGTELAKQDNYRDKVFRVMENLQILDSKDREGNEVEMDDFIDEDEFEGDGEDGEEGDDFEDEDDDEFDDEDEEDFDDEEDDDDEEESNHKKTKN